MCIISGEVEHVCETRIAVAPVNNNNTQQLTVYCNKVRMGANAGAMVLPFPAGPCTVLAPEDFDGEQLFSKLNDILPVMKSRGVYRNFALDGAAAPLEVFDVGSYQCSIATNAPDLHRINNSVFQINTDCLRFIEHNYPKGFGFMICILKKDAKYHPFAYVHAMRQDKKLFIPTVHYHEHVNESHHYATRSKNQPVISTDWDHEIFVLGTSGKIENLATEEGKISVGHFIPQKIPGVVQNFVSRALELCTGVPSQNLRGAKFTITDYHKNHDLVTEPVAV